MATHKRQNDLFAQRVKAERDDRGWTQREFAEMLGVHWTVIAKIESGQRSVKIDEAAQIADLFGLSIDVLLGRKADLRADVSYILRVLQHDAGKVALELDATLADIEWWYGQLEDARGVRVVTAREVTAEMKRDFARWKGFDGVIGRALSALREARDALYGVERFEPSPETTKRRAK